jgi:hypothetical protein
MRRWRRVRLAQLLTLSCLLAATLAPLVAAGAQPASGKVAQLTVPEAWQAFKTTWPEFDTAFAQGQLPLLPKYATSNVVEAASGSTGCGCTWTTPDSAVKFSIPVQSAYPISFLAQISTPAPRLSVDLPYITLVVFTKERSGGPWRVGYIIRYGKGPSYLDASTVKVPTRAAFDIGVVSSRLAQFFTAEVTTGAPPPDDNWPQTGSTGDEVQNYLETKAYVELQGGTQRTLFSPLGNSPAFAFPGGDIVCSAYISDSSVTPQANSPLVQPADRSTWGSQIRPGQYSSLTKLGMHEFCYAVHTDTGVVNPISFFGGVYKTTGVRAL